MMKKIFVGLVLLLVSACSSPTPNFYQLVSSDDVKVISSKFNKTVLIKPVLLEATFNHPQITTIGLNDYELKIDEFNRWGNNPDRLIQNTISKNLSAYLPNADIITSFSQTKKHAYSVGVEINDFTGKIGSYATFSASFDIKNAYGFTVKSGKFTKKVIIEKGYSNFVLKQSELIAEFSKDIAERLANL